MTAVDTSPLVGDQGGMRAHADGLSNVCVALARLPQVAKPAFEQALDHWEGGGRRTLYQHAASGIQAEILVLVTAVSSVADLVDAYTGAHKVGNEQMTDLADFWTGKQLELYSHPDDPGIKAEVEKAGVETAESADEIRRKLRRLAHLLARDIDQATELLVPGGSHLSPAAVARQVHLRLGDADPGGELTQAQIYGHLGRAASAVPASASKANGDFELGAFLRSLNDTAVTSTSLGGGGWAVSNPLEYHVSAAELARRTDRLYASIIGQSLAELQAGRVSATEHVGSILRYIAMEDSLVEQAGSQNAALLDDLRAGGRWNPAMSRVLAVLRVAGDIATLQNLDEYENPRWLDERMQA